MSRTMHEAVTTQCITNHWCSIDLIWAGVTGARDLRFSVNFGTDA